MKLEKAVEEVINACIEKDILKEFFMVQKAEVMAMSLYEYNEEYVKKSLYEEGEEVGMLKTLAKSVEAIMKNLHIDMKNACDIIGTTVEEYEKAKNIR